MPIEKLEAEGVVKAKLNDKFYYELVKQDNFENKISYKMSHTNESDNHS